MKIAYPSLPSLTIFMILPVAGVVWLHRWFR